jgi:hypothetical protein
VSTFIFEMPDVLDLCRISRPEVPVLAHRQADEWRFNRSRQRFHPRAEPDFLLRSTALLAAGAFDGFVNIGAFNCAPASTASAVIHTLSHRTDTPYAVIECDGDCMTTGQLRQLETVAVQCRRSREARKEPGAI